MDTNTNDKPLNPEPARQDDLQVNVAGKNSNDASGYINRFQNTGTLLALVISVLALFVSVYEAQLIRDQQKAMVWPYLTVTSNYSGKGFAFEANNNGVGPALIKSIEVRYQGNPVENFDDLLDHIKPDRKVGYGSIRMSSFNQTVMKAGEEREIFLMPWEDETRLIVTKMPEVGIKVCFCSVLEDCWIYDSATKAVSPGVFKAEVEFRQ
ncbi:MAG: hypothetical protein KI786_07615 [Mameliella sp.]|nr:hypothetical protein [Phaeodactylibacter sp.]